MYSKDAVSCTLLLYHRGEKEPYLELTFPEKFRIGNVFTMMVFGLNIEELEYGYKMDGPCDHEQGFYFDKDIPLLDPYAKSVSGREIWGKESDTNEKFQHRGRVIMEDYDWEGDRPYGRG